MVRCRGLRNVVATAVLAAAYVSTVGAPVRADSDAGLPRASMTCDRADGPGRVRCDVEARVSPGESITWGDVVILRTPPFATALRGRIGPHEATVREPDVWRWALALVARTKGTGDVDARVRLVVCEGDVCTPREVDVIGHVIAGD
jgi:hypothetical protein